MDRDTDIGGPQGRFPLTRNSVLRAVGDPAPDVRERGFAALVEAYWKPVYKYMRVKWRASNEDAKDLTQEFFARAFEKGFFEGYDPARARFRTYLRVCLDGFLSNQRKAARRIKRGGDTQVLSLDFEGAEGQVLAQQVPDGLDLEAYFYREWVRWLFEHAVDALRERGRAASKAESLLVFERYDLTEAASRPTYADLGHELDLPVTQVTNHLAWARRALREIVLEKLRAVSASDEEFRAEARQLLGIDPR
ncbi:MAG TPA: sigma-70 family RNA polymerase sigma factor [Vicinamibacteria bacterium]|nr:sigma-70 family RNA polymerase sigma factor [Vicinamibacteria bacterium]